MSAPERREAWGHRDPRGRRARRAPDYDLPHLVAWPLEVAAGRALCGKELTPLRLEPLGAAEIAGVALCPRCVAATRPIRRERARTRRTPAPAPGRLW